METSDRDTPMGYTSRSNSSSGSVAQCAALAADASNGSVSVFGNQSCIPLAPYVHQGISTSSFSSGPESYPNYLTSYVIATAHPQFADAFYCEFKSVCVRCQSLPGNAQVR